MKTETGKVAIELGDLESQSVNKGNVPAPSLHAVPESALQGSGTLERHHSARLGSEPNGLMLLSFI
jgi:hypothetical protein